MLRVYPFFILWLSAAVLNAQHGIVVAAGGGVSTIGVVNTATNTPALSLPVTGQFASFAVTPGGASAYFIKESPSQVVLIDLSTGSINATISIPSTGISAIALSPDGSQLFMVGTGGATFPLQVFVVDTASNTVTKSTSLPDTDVPMLGYQIAVSTDGSRLFVPSTSNPANLYVLSAPTLQVEATIRLTFSSFSLTVTPNALFVGGSSGSQAYVAYVDLTGYGLLNTFSLPNAKCAGQLAADAQRDILYAIGTGCGSSGKEIYAIYTPTSALLADAPSIATLLALSPDGNTLYAGQPGGIAEYDSTNLNAYNLVRTAYFPQPGVVQAIELTPNGASLIATNSSSATLFYTDPDTGAPISSFSTGPVSFAGTVNAVATCNAGRTSYLSDTTGNLAVFDNTTLAPAVNPYLPTGFGPGLFACQSNGGPLVVFASGTNTLAGIALDGAAVAKQHVSGSHFAQLAATPDGSKAFLSEQSGSPETVQVFSLPGLESGGTIPVAAGSPYPIAFSPDSTHTYIGTYSVPGAAIIDVDTATNAINRTISLPDPLATSITVSPDGKTLYVLANVNLDVVDLASTTVTTYPVAFSAYHIPYLSAISPDGTKIHIVENGEEYVLSVFDTVDKKITSRVKYPGALSGVAFTSY